MKKNSTLKLMILSLMAFVLPSLTIAQVDVTFKVDMTGVDMTNATGVYIVGDYELNAWVHSEMTLESGNIYSVTLSLAEGTDPIYYYTMVTDWSSRETVPGECANSGTKTDDDATKIWTGDRLIVVPAQALIVEEPYGGCNAPTNVATSQLKMTNVDAISGGIKLSVETPEYITIVSIDGTVVCSKTVGGSQVVDCARGVYIVKGESFVKKVLVLE